MRFWSLILLLTIGFTSCKSARVVPSNKQGISQNKVTKLNSTNSLVDKIINHAQSFDGTKYKYGGTTKKGMDCSGLIYVSFKTENIHLPRISRDMATEGEHIKLNEVKKGDLLFFQTRKNKRSINHVGLVISIERNHINFIHSTSSRGVITSSLSESYWINSFKEARRIL